MIPQIVGVERLSNALGLNASMRRGQHVRPRRSVEDWLLVVLSAEKAAQHVFISWAFAAGRFDLRGQVVPPWEALFVIGSVSAVLFVVALPGIWRRQRWAPTLLIGLALVDIIGEFVAQGTLMIHIVVSFIVAPALLVLAWRARRRYEV